ncbi:MAG: BREX system ATP-binding domain-containing protein, partial [Acidobacteriota bacterium]
MMARPAADSETKFAARSAIEALRAGVPNSYSVRALGCDQPRIEMAFVEQLETVAAAGSVEGLLIRGDFGTGKSHSLGFLREIALDQKFVVSRVYV